MPCASSDFIAFFSIPRLITIGLGGERAGASDRRVARLWELQAFRRLIFHGCAECAEEWLRKGFGGD
jgi:hypothetical protein